jgi:ATP-dependent Clp protease ATP-binding subunit ClpA
MPAPSADLDHILRDLATQEARRYQVDYIGTEHFLLALVRRASDEPVFQALHLNEVDVRRRIDRVVTLGPAHDASDSLPYTPLLKKSLDRARGVKRKSERITATDLLAGLAAVDSVASIILSDMGVTEALIRKVGKQLREGTPVEIIRNQLEPPDPLAFALPFAKDPYVSAKIEEIRTREKEKWEMVEARRFEEAALIREELIKEVTRLRQYCSNEKYR